ncbi:MAG: hypothetical protein CME59_14140 [Halioglobus sp.]|nr:hypothetical protein [Halioglobus sp.]|tara:strand:- start:1842 stop:2465 length:624 start_codon:yes stop_codon:yes gene_type:complete
MRSVFTLARSWLLAQVDAAIPVQIRNGDSDTLRRSRIILSFCLVLILLGLETGLFFSWMLEPVAAQRVGLALVCALLLALCIPQVLRRNGSITLAANMIIGASYLVTVAVITVIGGIEAPLIHWCALFPMLAALMGSRTSAWVWVCISLCTVVVFVFADQAGIKFADSLGFAELQGAPLWFQRSANLVSWLGILLGVALLFEEHKND